MNQTHAIFVIREPAVLEGQATLWHLVVQREVVDELCALRILNVDYRLVLIMIALGKLPGLWANCFSWLGVSIINFDTPLDRRSSLCLKLLLLLLQDD
jgi:hypothetical protein